MKILMRLFKHRGIYYVERDGKRTSLKTRNKDEAKRLYTAYKKQVLAGKVAKLEGRSEKNLKDFAEEYVKWAENVLPRSTFRANRLALEKLKHYAGEKIGLDRISLKHIDMMISDLKTLSPHSVNNYIRHARVVLNKAVSWGYLQSNPLRTAKEVKTARKPPAFLDRAQASQFIASIKDVGLRRMVVAYLATGRRRSELLRLRWEEVNLERGTYQVKTKGGDYRLFGINSMFRAVLASIREHHSTGRIFGRWNHPDTISHVIKGALKTAGFGHLHLHHLRHSFASIQLMSGKSIFDLKELLGHEDIKATQIYSHLTEEYLSDIGEINLGPVDLQGD